MRYRGFPLFVLVSGLLVTFLLAMYSWQSFTKNAELEKARLISSLSDELHELGDEIKFRFTSIAGLSQALSALVHGKYPDGVPKALTARDNNLIDNLVAPYKSLRTAILMDPSGTIIGDSRPGRPALGFDVKDRMYFRAHLERNIKGPFISSPVVSRIDRQWTWVVSTAVRNAQNELLAVAGVSIDRRFFHSLFVSNGDHADGFLLLVHDNGTVMETNDDDLKLIGTSLPNVETLLADPKRIRIASGRLPGSAEPQTQFAISLKPWPISLIGAYDNSTIDAFVHASVAARTYWMIALVSLTFLLTVFAYFIARRLVRSNIEVVERESLLANAQELSDIGHFIWNLETGEVTWSEQLYRMLGYTPDDDIDFEKVETAVHHSEDRVRIKQWLESAMQTGTKNLPTNTYRLVRKDGSVIRVRANGRFDFNGKQPVRLFGTIQDISEDRRREGRAERYLKTANNLFVALDGAGYVIDVNDLTCQRLEANREQIIGSDWITKYLPDEERDSNFTLMNEIRNDKELTTGAYENQIVSPSGKRFTIAWHYSIERDKAGRLVELIAFGSDVTEQRRAEREIRLLSRFPQENPAPIIRLRRSDKNETGGSPTANVVMANQAAQDLFASEFPEDKSDATELRDFLKSCAEAETATTREIEVNYRTLLFSVVPVAGEDYVNIYGTDITASRELQMRLQDITDNLPGAVFQYVRQPDGRDEINFMSPRCEDIWEIDAASIEADVTPLWDMIHPDDIEATRRSVQASAENLTAWQHEWRSITPSGTEKWLRGTGLPHHSPGGGVVWNSVIEDISDSKKAAEGISQALTKTVQVLAATLEARDPYTAGHEEQVTDIAVKIAERMGLDAKRIDGLRLAALIHDVGKIQVPAEILSKPSQLNDPELNLIKMHPQTGANLLRNVEFEWPIADIVLQHHERMDGSGYPNGLTGDRILLEARILAVADTLDAMASHRPYRPGLGLKAAAEEIRRGAGKLYDAKVATICLALIDEGVIKDPYGVISQAV
jgi:PAS domain S-box-containing protein/putative nucleotidyltransferase with HDIG domain